MPTRHLAKYKFRKGAKRGKAHGNYKRKGAMPAGLKRFLVRRKRK